MNGPTWSVAMVAPAKLTLTLRVLGTRPDGFHALDALTVCVSAPADRVAIAGETGPGVRLVVTGADTGVPTGDDNLVVRAAKLFLATTKIKAGIAINLEKQIPHGAGLGVGSSDAATTLLGLNELFGSALKQEPLLKPSCKMV